MCSMWHLSVTAENAMAAVATTLGHILSVYATI